MTYKAIKKKQKIHRFIARTLLIRGKKENKDTA